MPIKGDSGGWLNTAVCPDFFLTNEISMLIWNEPFVNCMVGRGKAGMLSERTLATGP